MQLAMPSVFKEDASAPNWRMVLDEIKSVKERLDELTLGQRRIQEKLGTEVSQPLMSTETMARQSSKTSGNSEDSGGAGEAPRRMRRQSTTSLSPSRRSRAGETSPQHVDQRLLTTRTVDSSNKVNHFESMAEKELKIVFEERQKARDENQEVSEYIARKTRRITSKKSAELSVKVTEWKWSRDIAKGLAKLNSEELELLFDSVIGLIIFANAVFVGISMDAEDADSGGYLVVQIIFAIIFWAEMILKLRVHGCRPRYCCGIIKEKDSHETTVRNMPPRRTSCAESFSNCFDLSLVVIDTLQLVILLGFKDANDRMNGTGISASLFRVVRLLRLVRILRLLRAEVFKDLLSMIQGMMCGFGTLGWSLALFVLFIYVVALIFREVVGPKAEDVSDDSVEWYFRTVPRSMFTIFRCSFGDCNTGAGLPIPEGVIKRTGGVWLSLLYSCFVFLVMIGLFNVISAIFVESTLATASGLTAEKQRRRLENRQRWGVNFLKLLEAVLSHSKPDDKEFLDDLRYGELSEPLLERLREEEIERSFFDEALEFDGNAQRALQELDIQKADHRFLSDILDPDNSGSVGVFELLDGIQRLRGDPRRSDIIAVDLMVRSIQLKIDDIWRWANDAQSNGIDKPADVGGALQDGQAMKNVRTC